MYFNVTTDSERSQQILRMSQSDSDGSNVTKMASPDNSDNLEPATGDKSNGIERSDDEFLGKKKMDAVGQSVNAVREEPDDMSGIEKNIEIIESNANSQNNGDSDGESVRI